MARSKRDCEPAIGMHYLALVEVIDNLPGSAFSAAADVPVIENCRFDRHQRVCRQSLTCFAAHADSPGIKNLFDRAGLCRF